MGKKTFRRKEGFFIFVLPVLVTFVLAFNHLSFLEDFRADLRPVKDNREKQFQKAREEMVKRDLLGRDIADVKVLEVMGKVPRHLFVDSRYMNSAYGDYPLPIDEGQTISQPYVVALMTQAIQLKPGERVLEIGTGSGYQAAVLAEITDFVYTIEIREKLAEKASWTLKKLGYDRVKVKVGDGYFGWPEYAPYQAIMVTAAANHIPPPLIQQLDEGGRLILPLGSTTYYQNLTVVEKRNGEVSTSHIGRVRFVPMAGRVLESSNGQ